MPRKDLLGAGRRQVSAIQSDLDGSSKVPLIEFDMEWDHGIEWVAVDPKTGRIFWDREAPQRAQNVGCRFATRLPRPRRRSDRTEALLGGGRKEEQRDHPRIRRCDLNGRHIETVIDFPRAPRRYVPHDRLRLGRRGRYESGIAEGLWGG